MINVVQLYRRFIWYIHEKINENMFRDKCISMYGEEFGTLYDTINMGGTIGTFYETCIFLDMIDNARLSYEEDKKRYIKEGHI